MKHGKIIKILEELRERTKIIVLIEGKQELAINYNFITGKVNINDIVILNTTAVELNLGTGGYHFVIYNLNASQQQFRGDGHIMKLRYTPFQFRVFAEEEEENPNHNIFNEFESLDKFPVIVGTLHSMLTPLVATLKYIDPNIRIAYIMTDGAALPIYFSDTVYKLVKKGLITTTITIGHAFGGDIETINIYNGLIAAKEIANCDIAVITMGPGIVGTSTPYGFTGIEQGHILDVVNDLGGFSIAVPRISFSDPRERHYGISHHSLTIFSKITKRKCNIPIPLLPIEKKQCILNQIEDLKIQEKHNIIEVDAGILPEVLKYFNLFVKTMGRGYYDDPAFFLACGAAALYSRYSNK